MYAEGHQVLLVCYGWIGMFVQNSSYFAPISMVSYVNDYCTNPVASHMTRTTEDFSRWNCETEYQFRLVDCFNCFNKVHLQPGW